MVKHIGKRLRPLRQRGVIAQTEAGKRRADTFLIKPFRCQPFQETFLIALGGSLTPAGEPGFDQRLLIGNIQRNKLIGEAFWQGCGGSHDFTEFSRRHLPSFASGFAGHSTPVSARRPQRNCIYAYFFRQRHQVRRRDAISGCHPARGRAFR